MGFSTEEVNELKEQFDLFDMIGEGECESTVVQTQTSVSSVVSFVTECEIVRESVAFGSGGTCVKIGRT